MPKDHVSNTNPLEMEAENELQQRANEIYAGPLSTNPRRSTLKSTLDGQIVFGKVQLTSIGLSVSGDTTEDEWLALGGILKRLDDSIQWLVGDWVVGCQNVWADTYEQVVEQTGFKYETVKNLAYIARNVPLSVRSDKLKFSLYGLIAPLRFEDGSPDLERQSYWVNRAIAEMLTRKQLRDAINNIPPTLSTGTEATTQKSLISAEKPREFRKFLKLALKAGQGDLKAKERALGQIAIQRKWLDDLEEWLKG